MLQETIGSGGADLYNSAVCMRPYISYSFFLLAREQDFRNFPSPAYCHIKVIGISWKGSAVFYVRTW